MRVFTKIRIPPCSQSTNGLFLNVVVTQGTTTQALTVEVVKLSKEASRLMLNHFMLIQPLSRASSEYSYA